MDLGESLWIFNKILHIETSIYWIFLLSSVILKKPKKIYISNSLVISFKQEYLKEKRKRKKKFGWFVETY